MNVNDQERFDLSCSFCRKYLKAARHDMVKCSKRVRFDELIKKRPGVLFVSDIFPDPEKGTLTGFTFWESEDAWPVLVNEAPSGDGEVKPAEVYLLNSAG